MGVVEEGAGHLLHLQGEGAEELQVLPKEEEEGGRGQLQIQEEGAEEGEGHQDLLRRLQEGAEVEGDHSPET